ncbi:MAG: hypothetical protein D3922_00665 [Candidatus Electrothrix sp. AR1]|nr:hypothetical protein [Candidatus Electrothrix sp. AR1]
MYDKNRCQCLASTN